MRSSALKKQQENLQVQFNNVAQCLLLTVKSSIHGEPSKHFNDFELSLRPITSLESAEDLRLRYERMIPFISDNEKQLSQNNFPFPSVKDVMDLLEQMQVPALMQKVMQEDSELLKNLSQR